MRGIVLAFNARVQMFAKYDSAISLRCSRCFMFILPVPVELLFLQAHVVLQICIGVMLMCSGLSFMVCLLVLRYRLDVEWSVAPANCLL